MPYIGTSPSNGVRRVFDYTATAGQTSFSGSDNNSQTLAYTDSAYIDVYQNGILLIPSDYTATTGTTVVLDTGATVSDTVQIVVYDVFSVADTVSASDGGSFGGNVGVGGTLSVTGIGTFSDDIIIGDGKTIGSASDVDAMTISSGGVVTFSQTPVGDFNSPYWFGQKASDQTVARVTEVVITGMTTNEKDSNSAFNGTTFTVPSGGAGLYYIFGTILYDWGDAGNDGEQSSVRIVHTPSGGSATQLTNGILNFGSTVTLHDISVTTSIMFQLGVGDTVDMRAYSADNNGSGGGVVKATYTNFGGFKIAG